VAYDMFSVQNGFNKDALSKSFILAFTQAIWNVQVNQNGLLTEWDVLYSGVRRWC